MELYRLYYTIYINTIGVKKTVNLNILLNSIIVAFVIWFLLFILQGIGLYVMAKRRGISKRYLAFIPFANIALIGKLAGKCQLFGRQVKRAGLYTMLAQILTTVFSIIYVGVTVYLFIANGAPTVLSTGVGSFELVWSNDFNPISFRMHKVMEICYYIVPFLELIYQILFLVLLMGLYKNYQPKNYTLLAMIDLFIPLAHFIVIFVNRNKPYIDFDAYMRARREAYIRQRQQYHGYGNPYGYGARPNYPPYPGQNPSSQSQNKPPEDPFAEFNGEKDKPKDEQSESDEFFN